MATMDTELHMRTSCCNLWVSNIISESNGANHARCKFECSLDHPRRIIKINNNCAVIYHIVDICIARKSIYKQYNSIVWRRTKNKALSWDWKKTVKKERRIIIIKTMIKYKKALLNVYEIYYNFFFRICITVNTKNYY